jgi:type I restriction enzyme R subunit
LDKKQLTESDIRARFITPSIERAGWDPMTQIFHEFGLRAGRISVRGRAAHRDQATILKADYALFFKPNIPIAAVEAKDNNHGIGAGMPQAIEYARLLDVPFAFASNGDGFIFRDETLTDGVLEKQIALNDFPSPQQLWDRYCAWKC